MKEIKQNSTDFYSKLLEFDDDKTKNINYVKEILYKFSYCNLADVFDTPELIRKSVINYLYTGKFKLEDDTVITKDAKTCLKKILNYNDSDKLIELRQKLRVEIKKSKEVTITEKKREKINSEIVKINNDIKANKSKLYKKVDFDAFYEQVHENWENIHEKHEELIKKFVNNEKLVKYLIVYEAPPYFYTKENYFLISNGGTYGNPIKECFSNSVKKDNISEILYEKETIYFDLIMAGIPIADAEIGIQGAPKPKPIRYFWSIDKRWEIGGKQLPIILLELGIFHLFNMGVKFDKRPFIAIGTPLNTSASLFEHYSKNYLKVYYENPRKKEAKEITLGDFENLKFEANGKSIEFFTANLSLVNTPSTFEIRGTNGETYPLFKSNIIGSSNYPHANLLKNAFNII
jgi:hypothetical protein